MSPKDASKGVDADSLMRLKALATCLSVCVGAISPDLNEVRNALKSAASWKALIPLCASLNEWWLCGQCMLCVKVDYWYLEEWAVGVTRLCGGVGCGSVDCGGVGCGSLDCVEEWAVGMCGGVGCGSVDCVEEWTVGVCGGVGCGSVDL